MIDPTGLFWQGVAIGAVVGAVSQYAIGVAVDLKSEGAKAFIPSKNEWKSIGASAVGGAVTGAVSGGLSAVKNVGKAIDTIRAVKIATSVTAGMAGGASQRLTDNALQGRDSSDGLLEHTLVGGAGGGLLGGTSPMKGHTELVGNILTGSTENITRDMTTQTARTIVGKEILTGVSENLLKESGKEANQRNTETEGQ